jgi:hypothetical protein
LIDEDESEEIYQKLVEVKFYLKQYAKADDEEKEFLKSKNVFKQLK